MSGPANGIVDFYERNAARFDAERGRGLMEKKWLDRFLALAGLGAHVLDIGCGAGEPVAQYIIERGFALTGVDSSTAMIGMCRRRFSGADWVVADMRSLALHRRFGALIAWNSFFHLSHQAQRRMFAIFAAHAEPGAPLLFTCGPEKGEAVGSMYGEPLYHASLDEAEYSALLDANDMDLLDFVREDPTCGRHTICLARRRRGEVLAGA